MNSDFDGDEGNLYKFEDITEKINQKKQFMSKLGNSTLYYLSPSRFSKFGRERFIESISQDPDWNLDKIKFDLVCNPDVYDSEIRFINKVFYQIKNQGTKVTK